MDSKNVRTLYLDFFKNQDHQFVNPAPLIPENDPTTLFTSAGMQQFVPYLKGQIHPQGTRLVNSQPCFRSQDIDEVGDNRHTTFFEMLGNWSFGDYFKKQQLTWFFTFLTSKIGLNPDRLYVSVFAGNSDIPLDQQSIDIWQNLFKNHNPVKSGNLGFDPTTKIYTYPASKNWWSRAGEPDNMPVGEIGGPDSEVFYDFDPDGSQKLHQKSEFADQPCHINCDCGRFLEIGNSVFMQFEKTTSGFNLLPKQNVDFGGGLERIVAASQNQSDIFLTDLFKPLLAIIHNQTGKSYLDFKTEFRIIVDHLKAASFMIAQGLEPSNKAQGYFLRRLIRRALLKLSSLSDTTDFNYQDFCQQLSLIYLPAYPEVSDYPSIAKTIQIEADKFTRTLKKGLAEFDKIINQQLTADLAFRLYETYGFPLEISIETAQSQNIKIEDKIITKFQKASQAHADKSRTASKGMFKGGLGGQSQKIIAYHTTTHLLHQALRQILGSHVSQAGSNITEDQLRFDFTHHQKLSPEEVNQVEALVNDQIDQALPVTSKTMSLQQAQAQNALAFFTDKYKSEVTVYSVGDFSKEVCGGPHVENTSQLGHFSITKQKSIGAGKLRIYANLA